MCDIMMMSLQATLVFSQELAMKQHEAEAVFAGNEALIAKATQGMLIYKCICKGVRACRLGMVT